MPGVHPSAIVAEGAKLGAGVEIGPYAVLGPDVELGAGVVIGPHVVIEGRTRIGAGTRVSPQACLGGHPQHREYEAPTRLVIGERNEIREHVSIHVGTGEGEHGETRIGDDNWIMNGAHVAHDCSVGSRTVIASFSGLAGHAVVEDHAVLGAYTGVHQYARVGESAMTASGAKLSLDAPPFSLVAGDRARVVGLNAVGLKRRGFTPETRSAIKRAHRLVFTSRLGLADALEQVEAEVGDVPEVARWMRFLRESERGFCRA